MKVLLINPPCDATNPVFPFGLAWIAAVLEKAGVDVKAIDAWAERLKFEQLKEKIVSLKPNIIGITMMSPILISAMKTVDIAKRAAPQATVVVGGSHPSSLPKECLEDNPNIDVVVIGEGEYTLLELVETLRNGGDLEHVEGIAYVQSGSVTFTNPREPIGDLDSLPSPAYHLFPVDKYRTHPPYGRKNPYASMITSRGCPFHCVYCSNAVFGRKLRAQSPQKVIEEIENLIQKYQVKEIHFYDDCFTLNIKGTKLVCEEILRRKIKIIWSCTTRLDLVNRELLQLMKKAGCWLISYGVESGCQEILDWMKKEIKVEEMKKGFRLTKEVGIRTLAFFMIGSPGETRETIHKTIDLCFELDPDFIAWGMLRIFPGSSLYESTQQRRFGKQKICRYSSLQHAMTNMPFGEQGFFVTFEGSFTEQELRTVIKQVYRKFYFRPGYIAKRLFLIRSFSEFVQYIRGGVEVLKWMGVPRH